ncbi:MULTISPECIES: hypothetical protein [Mycolicibacterium]|nr:hypothetical protein [Mycolicibacterium chlorophenolicum]
MAANSAMIQGASKVMIVDRHPDRLRLSEEVGVIPIDDSKGDPVEQVMEHTGGGVPTRVANASDIKPMTLRDTKIRR